MRKIHFLRRNLGFSVLWHPDASLKLTLHKLIIFYLFFLQLALEGLTVEGMTKEEVDNLFKNYLLKYFQDNSKIVCQKIARQFMLEANEIIKGKSLAEIIDWLKHFIGGGTTAAP